VKLTLEVSANLLNAASIWLAGKNSLHTWWTGICGCALFAWLFFEARLYADVTLQLFFIGSCVLGHLRWRPGQTTEAPGVTHAARELWITSALAAGLTAYVYGRLLAYFTNAASPFVDSLVLTFSVLGQVLLVARKVESWWCWIVVNTLAVPLYASRGLYLTAVMYFGFWVNAWIALRHFRQLAAAGAKA
jgi:nicotinamide mononucleotide transporter